MKVTCPNCGHEHNITIKKLAQGMGAKGGKVKSEAKTLANRENIRKRWAKKNNTE